jgi:hypothetical protein
MTWEIVVKSAVVAIGIVVNACPMLAQAQTIPARSTCAADYKRLCYTIPPDDAQATECLNRNLASLSPACRATFQSDPGNKPVKESDDWLYRRKVR